MKKFKNFIFDMDGTIWDAAIPAAEGFTEAIRRSGKSNKIITVQDIHENFGKTMYEIAANWFPHLPAEEGNQIISDCAHLQCEYMKDYDGDMMYPEGRETIKKLSESCGLYIVSNCLDGYVDMLYEKYGMAPYFKDFAFLDHPKNNKADNIRYMVEKYNLEDACYVGDIQGDYNATMQAGIDFIHAAYGYGKVPEAKYVVKEFKDLLKFI